MDDVVVLGAGGGGGGWVTCFDIGHFRNQRDVGFRMVVVASRESDCGASELRINVVHCFCFVLLSFFLGMDDLVVLGASGENRGWVECCDIGHFRNH
jgi:hypothetical protein